MSTVPDSNIEVSQMLKEATQLKKDGNLTAAITKLKQAESAIKGSGADYGIDTFLRLPMYLQSAARIDEAIQRLNQLLREYPEPWGRKIKFDRHGTYPMHIDISRGIIYDKLRLVYKRDNNSEKALPCAVLARANAYSAIFSIRAVENGLIEKMRAISSDRNARSCILS